MWGRSFHGITGQVTIDANGDRLSDYSLFDMNPESAAFEVDFFWILMKLFWKILINLIN